MKKLIILVVLFFCAVAISPMLINEKGYILIAMGDLTIESTVVTASIMLTLLFITLLISLKVLRGGLKLSFSTWNKLIFANRRKALREFNQGITAYALEDYQQAEQLLAKCAEKSQFEQTAYLLAASAAQKQNLISNTKHYLTALEDHRQTMQETGLEGILIKIKLLLEQDSFGHDNLEQARALIDEHHKHIGHDARLLSLEINLCIMEQRFESAVEYLTSARKQKTIDEHVIKEWGKSAFYGAFNNIIQQKDNNALTDYWQKLAKKVKQREEVLFAYCLVLAENNIIEPLNKILIAPLKKEASQAFLQNLRTLPLQKPEELIIIVQKHLHSDPHSAKWLSCLGHMALSGGQFQMADKAFHSLMNIEGSQYDDIDLKAFASALEGQGEYQKANQLLRKVTN
ncbi:MAG: heme biosynthesis protein HemY [Alteromonadaceae bacterium]|nr:heme biosynthesis protein HemY [Alteromonadaceae bacterium]